jgi:hypothetical protein
MAITHITRRLRDWYANPATRLTIGGALFVAGARALVEALKRHQRELLELRCAHAVLAAECVVSAAMSSSEGER